LGLIAGFYRGWVDTLISRTVDVMMSLPLLLLALGLAAVCSATNKGCFGGHAHLAGSAGFVAWIVAAALVALALFWWLRDHHGYALLLGVFALFAVLLHLHLPIPALQPGLPLVILIIAFANWTYIARIV